MAPNVFSYDELEYVKDHLRILSAFYGVLCPTDGVTPYRLEMQAKAKINASKDLYDFWGKDLYDNVIDDSRIIIDLASKEYSKCITKYIKPTDKLINITFGEMENGKLVTKGVYAKMARGEMVRFMAINKIEDPEDLKAFNSLGYSYIEDLSSTDSFVFERK